MYDILRLKHVRVEKNNCEQHLTEFRYELMHRPNTVEKEHGLHHFGTLVIPPGGDLEW